MIERFFGDGEHKLAFTLPLLNELETKTGRGVGELFLRLRSSLYSVNDLAEVVRLALIGGGKSPKRAAELIAAYGPPARPLIELQILAVEILTDLMAGQATSDTTESMPGTNGESTNG